MKKSKLLLSMMVLSILVSFYRIYDLFFKTTSNIKMKPTGDIEIDRMLEESQRFAQQQSLFQKNLLNQFLVIMLVFIVLMTLVSYITKQYVFSYILYSLYIIVCLAHAIYRFQNMKTIISSITISSASQFAELGNKLTFYWSLLTFFLYMGVLLYKLFITDRKVSRVRNKNLLIDN